MLVDQTTAVPPTTPVLATIAGPVATGTKVKAGAVVLRDGDEITVTAITVPAAGATIPDPGPYTVAMVATATKSKAEGIEVLREGDLSDTVSATPQIPGTPDPTDYPVSFKCIVDVAGQIKVKAQ
jgi:hypothetical protein